MSSTKNTNSGCFLYRVRGSRNSARKVIYVINQSTVSEKKVFKEHLREGPTFLADQGVL